MILKAVIVVSLCLVAFLTGAVGASRMAGGDEIFDPVNVMRRSAKRQEAHRIANDLATKFVAGDMKAVHSQFNLQLSQEVSPDDLANLWSAIQEQLGPFQRIGHSIQESGYEYEMVRVICSFQRDNVYFRVAVLSNGKIGGLFLDPVIDPR